MSDRYFGTDGIRGVVGKGAVSEEFFYKLGKAVCIYLVQELKKQPSLAIGRDPRLSGKCLKEAFCKGFSHANDAKIKDLGIVPTPAVSFFTKENNLSMGAVITASHNPASNNGIKFFNHLGEKISRKDEEKIERILDSIDEEEGNPLESKNLNFLAKIEKIDGQSYYIDKILSFYPKKFFSGKKIVVDTANGATSFTTPKILSSLGAEVVCLNFEQDGKHINKNCGSEHSAVFLNALKKENAWLGFAHDGDGDRVILCDENAKILDGDEVLGMLALEAFRNNNLANNTLVVTQQSNSGLEVSLPSVKIERSDVGDREVYQAMLKTGACIGGESSGHVIIKNYANTGDGIIAALEVLKLALDTPISEGRKSINLLPKKEDFINVEKKFPLNQLTCLQNTYKNVYNYLSKNEGRLIVRYSGTENKLRFLVEAKNDILAAKYIERLKSAARSDIRELNDKKTKEDL